MALEILLIEDEPSDAEFFSRVMEREAPGQYHITHLETVEEVERLSSGGIFDVAMLDMNLPGLSGFDAVRFIQEKHNSLPVIILSGSDDEEKAVRAASMGVQDYLVKGKSSGEVIRRSIRYSIERKRYEEKILYLTRYDQLTGLMNTQLFNSLLKQAIIRAKRDHTTLAIYYIDLDNFRHVNDAYGMEVGNTLLIEVAGRLKSILEEGTLVSRLTGDKFVVALEDNGDLDVCAVLAERMGLTIGEPFSISGHDISTSASVGIATYPKCGQDSTSLVKNAEAALYIAKDEGRSHYRFFTSELNEKITERIHITSALRDADIEREFYLHYQPTLDLRTGKVIGAEALLRWQHLELGTVMPERFIPLAEEAGLIDKVSSWVMETACQDYLRMEKPEMEIALNLSSKQLHHSMLVRTIKETLQRSSMPAERLALELTESAVMSDTEAAFELMGQLKDMGIKIYIDDFGTGYSSLTLLRRAPIDALKIDRTFVHDMTDNKEDSKIIRLVIDLAHDLGMKVIAEGVETAKQANMLRLMGCDMAQGHLYSVSRELGDFKRWLHEYVAY